MNTLIDYTQMRRNSSIHGYSVVVCPKCKRRGLCLPTHGGMIIFMHKGERTKAGIEMVEGCEVEVGGHAQ